MATILTSWKEIAQYLGKGVRTVQRWEHALGLPVRRPNQNSLNVVIALQEEIDAWVIAQQGTEHFEADDLRRAIALLTRENQLLRSRIQQLEDATRPNPQLELAKALHVVDDAQRVSLNQLEVIPQKNQKAG